MELDFSPWNHDLGFRITYQGVEPSTLSLSPASGASGCGTVLLDEVLPDAVGVLHEIVLTGGDFVVVARDREASWRSRAALAQGLLVVAPQ